MTRNNNEGTCKMSPMSPGDMSPKPRRGHLGTHPLKGVSLVPGFVPNPEVRS